MSEIADLINKLANPKKTDKYFVGEVTAVDGIFCNVMPADGTAELQGIRLCAEDHNSNFIVIPAVGSVVYVTMDSETDGIVTGFSEVDEIYLRGDAYDGLVKVGDLVTRLNLIENNFNAFVTAFNALVSVYSAHIHIPLGPPPLTPGAPFPTVLTPTTQVMIENTKVKHG